MKYDLLPGYRIPDLFHSPEMGEYRQQTLESAIILALVDEPAGLRKSEIKAKVRKESIPEVFDAVSRYRWDKAFLNLRLKGTIAIPELNYRGGYDSVCIYGKQAPGFWFTRGEK